MDAELFRKNAELNGELADYLDEFAQAAAPTQGQRTVGLDALFLVASYALFRLSKNYFDHQRGLSEAELRQKMLDQVDVLVKAGWGHDAALGVIQQVSKDIATLRADSPILKAALELFQKSANSTGGK